MAKTQQPRNIRDCKLDRTNIHTHIKQTEKCCFVKNTMGGCAVFSSGEKLFKRRTRGDKIGARRELGGKVRTDAEVRGAPIVFIDFSLHNKLEQRVCLARHR